MSLARYDGGEQGSGERLQNGDSYRNTICCNAYKCNM